MDTESVQFFFNNIFSIGVTIYLLFERSKFNEKTAVTLERISNNLALIEAKLGGK